MNNNLDEGNILLKKNKFKWIYGRNFEKISNVGFANQKTNRGKFKEKNNQKVI